MVAPTQTQISITAMDACMLQAADVLFFKDLKTPSHPLFFSAGRCHNPRD